MTSDFKKTVMGVFAAMLLLGLAPFGSAQDKPADNMQILREKIRADKKLVVACRFSRTNASRRARRA